MPKLGKIALKSFQIGGFYFFAFSGLDCKSGKWFCGGYIVIGYAYEIVAFALEERRRFNGKRFAVGPERVHMGVAFEPAFASARRAVRGDAGEGKLRRGA